MKAAVEQIEQAEKQQLESGQQVNESCVFYFTDMNPGTHSQDRFVFTSINTHTHTFALCICIAHSFYIIVFISARIYTP